MGVSTLADLLVTKLIIAMDMVLFDQLLNLIDSDKLKLNRRYLCHLAVKSIPMLFLGLI